MNILLSSAGRRNYLVRYFRKALNGTGLVIAADACKDAPALAEADISVIVTPFSDRSYVDTLLDVCRRYQVALVLPLNDFELPLLARAAERFLQEAGARAVVSDPAVIDVCCDKLAAMVFLEQHAIAAPRTYAGLAAASEALRCGALEFPVIVKPRWGSGSVGLFHADSQPELEVAAAWCLRAIRATTPLSSAGGMEDQAVLVQEKYTGTEYGFDVVNDLSGRYVCTLSRNKLNTWGGEADRAITVCHPGLEALGQRIGKTLGHVGMLDCDVIQTSRGLVVLDMNPRFGGGYPFSHSAGANLPSAFLAWARQEEPDASWFQYTPGVVSVKTLEISTTSLPQEVRFRARRERFAPVGA